MHQVVDCDSSGHATIINRSFRSGVDLVASGVQAVLSSSTEAEAVFKQCLGKLWRLGFAEFRLLDRSARASRSSSPSCHCFVSSWSSSMGHFMRLLQSLMTCWLRLLQRSAILSPAAKAAAAGSLVLPALTTPAWLNDMHQIISIAPSFTSRGLQQAAASLMSAVFQNTSYTSSTLIESRAAQFIRGGTMTLLQVVLCIPWLHFVTLLQVLAYSWQSDEKDNCAAAVRPMDDSIVEAMLEMWKLLPDPVVCAAIYSITRTLLQIPQLPSLLQDISTHAFIGASFISISSCFSSDFSAVAVAVNEGVCALQALLAFDDFRATASSSDIVACAVECCLRSWNTLNRLLHLEHDLLSAAVDAVAAPRPINSWPGGRDSGQFTNIAASIDPLLMWSDQYIRISDHASGDCIRRSSCPASCPYSCVSLSMSHLQILRHSIAYIIELFGRAPNFKVFIATNARVVHMALSAIEFHAALFNWTLYVC
jgi:hypothetical protein